MGLLGGASDQKSIYQCRRCKRHRFNPWVGQIPSISWTEEPGGLQSMGSDTTEQLSTHTQTHRHTQTHTHTHTHTVLDWPLVPELVTAELDSR